MTPRRLSDAGEPLAALVDGDPPRVLGVVVHRQVVAELGSDYQLGALGRRGIQHAEGGGEVLVDVGPGAELGRSDPEDVGHGGSLSLTPAVAASVTAFR